MATLDQIEAARRNGSLSRGPVSPDGKARSARNATRHGMHSNTVILRNESAELYNGIAEQYLAECEPRTVRERDLVMQIVNAHWRLARMNAMETAALDLEMDRQRPEIDLDIAGIDEPTRAAMAFTQLVDNSHALAMYGRSETRLRRTIDRAEAQLNLLQIRRLRKKHQNEPAIVTSPLT